jgi:hypothetical protein
VRREFGKFLVFYDTANRLAQRVPGEGGYAFEAAIGAGIAASKVFFAGEAAIGRYIPLEKAVRYNNAILQPTPAEAKMLADQRVRGARVYGTTELETMGELVTVTPASAPKVNFPSVADPSRSVTVVAVFKNKAKTVIMGSEGKMGGRAFSKPARRDLRPCFRVRLWRAARNAVTGPERRYYQFSERSREAPRSRCHRKAE